MDVFSTVAFREKDAIKYGKQSQRIKMIFSYENWLYDKQGCRFTMHVLAKILTAFQFQVTASLKRLLKMCKERAT